MGDYIKSEEQVTDWAATPGACATICETGQWAFDPWYVQWSPPGASHSPVLPPAPTLMEYLWRFQQSAWTNSTTNQMTSYIDLQWGVSSSHQVDISHHPTQRHHQYHLCGSYLHQSKAGHHHNDMLKRHRETFEDLETKKIKGSEHPFLTTNSAQRTRARVSNQPERHAQRGQDNTRYKLTAVN